MNRNRRPVAQRGIALCQSRLGWTVAVAFAALAARSGLLFGDAEITPGGDSEGYMVLADDISRGQFSMSTRTPGYPFFLWMVSVLPGRTEDGAILVQHLIGVGLAVLTLHMGWLLFDRAAGIVAALAMAVFPLGIVVGDLILADFLFMSVVFTGSAVLAVAARRCQRDWRLLATVGVIFAIAAYIKPVGQVLAFAPLIVLFTSRQPIRHWILPSLTVAVAMLVMLAPWAVRNYVVYDTVSITSQAGITLFNRAFEVQGLAVPVTDEEAALVAALTEEARETEGLRPSSHVFNQLTARDYTATEALALQQRLALEAIQLDALGYTKVSGKLLALRMADLKFSPGIDPVYRHADSAPGVAQLLTQAAVEYGGRFQRYFYTATGALAIGLLPLLRPRQRASALAMLAPPALVLIATVTTHGGLWRYSTVAAPQAWLLSSAGLILAVRALATALRAERSKAPLPCGRRNTGVSS